MRIELERKKIVGSVSLNKILTYYRDNKQRKLNLEQQNSVAI